MALLCVTVLQGVGGESLVAGRKSLVANDYRDDRQLRKSGCNVFYAVPFEGFR